uniref:Uncharacterized protein n=1 Tax=Panagrolaimus sp. ES5 TaxID=591445 RepID=A0AC34FMY0_9BILA
MKDKDKEKEKDTNEKDNKGKRSLRKFPFNMARSDPSTPASVTAPPSPSASGIPPRSETPFIPAPLDLRKSLSG